MSRPKEFDDDDVLDRAGELFLTFGFKATSIPALEAASGIGRGSLYTTFGDKDGLYLAALDRYQVKFVARWLSHLSDDNVGDGSGRCSRPSSRMAGPDAPNGFLATNSSVENDGRSKQIGAAVAATLDNVESRLQAAIQRAIRTKQVPRGTMRSNARDFSWPSRRASA